MSRPAHDPSSAGASGPDHPSSSSRECGICQSLIDPMDATFICPSCRLVYHADCWQSNLGCASYGCNQVNALGPQVDALELLDDGDAGLPPVDLATSDPKLAGSFPWSFLLLGGAGASLLISPLTWGIASALTLAGIGWRISKTRNWRDPVLILAGVICLVGIVAGLLLAPLWWQKVVVDQG